MEERKSEHAEHRILSMNLLRPTGKACLDAGCGWGRYLRDYVAHGAILTVGVDINPYNLNKCKEITGSELVRADIENLPFTNDAFDITSCVGTTEHLPKPSEVVRELERVLRKDGLFFATWNNYRWIRAFWDPHIRARLMGHIRDILSTIIPQIRKPRVHRNSGFSVKRVHSLLGKERLELVYTAFSSTHYYLTVAQKTRS